PGCELEVADALPVEVQLVEAVSGGIEAGALRSGIEVEAAPQVDGAAVAARCQRCWVRSGFVADEPGAPVGGIEEPGLEAVAVRPGGPAVAGEDLDAPGHPGTGAERQE